MTQDSGLDIITQGLSLKRGAEVHLSYPDINLPAGSQVAVTGPSGSGKTTLLHLLAGLLQPTSGTVKCGSQALYSLSEAKRDLFRQRNIGYLFQEFHLMPGLSALENVELGLRVAGLNKPRALAQQALEQLDLGNRLNHRPAQLSTGEKQRVALARAVAHRPKLLLADEPTAHLDAARAKVAIDMLQRTAHDLGATLVVVTHDLSIAKALPHHWPLQHEVSA